MLVGALGTHKPKAMSARSNFHYIRQLHTLISISITQHDQTTRNTTTVKEKDGKLTIGAATENPKKVLSTALRFNRALV